MAEQTPPEPPDSPTNPTDTTPPESPAPSGGVPRPPALPPAERPSVLERMRAKLKISGIDDTDIEQQIVDLAQKGSTSDKDDLEKQFRRYEWKRFAGLILMFASVLAIMLHLYFSIDSSTEFFKGSTITLVNMYEKFLSVEMETTYPPYQDESFYKGSHALEKSLDVLTYTTIAYVVSHAFIVAGSVTLGILMLRMGRALLDPPWDQPTKKTAKEENELLRSGDTIFEIIKQDGGILINAPTDFLKNVFDKLGEVFRSGSGFLDEVKTFIYKLFRLDRPD